jgi:hypothetical protein
MRAAHLGVLAKETWSETRSTMGTPGRRPWRGRIAKAAGGVSGKEARLKMMSRSCTCSVDSAKMKKMPWRFHPHVQRGERRRETATQFRKTPTKTLGQNSDSSVRIWRRQTASKQGGEEGEKGRHLTTKLMNTSEVADDVGGGRKQRFPRRSRGRGRGRWCRLRARFEDSWVEDGQRDEGKLLLALVQRKVVGDDGATATLRRMCAVFFSETFAPFFCVV